MSRELAIERSKEQQRKIKAENDMTTAKHTPGPWVAKQLEEESNCYEVMDEGGYYIATCHDGVWGERNADANASLIAVAPELLEVLGRVVSFWDKLNFDGSAINSLHADARLAIAKATGETP